jgi:hypothetical protein
MDELLTNLLKQNQSKIQNKFDYTQVKQARL